MPHVHDTTHIYMTYVCFTTDNYYTRICIWHNTHDIYVLIHGMCYVLCGLHYVLCSLCGLLICGMNPTHTYTYQRIYDRCMFYYWQLLHMYMTYMCWYAAWITCYVLCVINVTWHTAYNRNTSSKRLQPSDSTTKPDASIRPTTYTDTYIDIYTCKNRAPCHLYRHIFRYIHTYR